VIRSATKKANAYVIVAVYFSGRPASVVIRFRASSNRRMASSVPWVWIRVQMTYTCSV
jgi:hypothetical protein